MRNFRSIAATGLLAIYFQASTELGAQAEDLFGACASEVASNCSDVRPGHGRLYACLYSHDDKLSDRCLAATADIHESLDFFFEAVRFSKQECLSDIETFCSDVSTGGGRILSCLRGNQEHLETSCEDALDGFAVLKTPQDYHSE